MTVAGRRAVCNAELLSSGPRMFAFRFSVKERLIGYVCVHVHGGVVALADFCEKLKGFARWPNAIESEKVHHEEFPKFQGFTKLLSFAMLQVSWNFKYVHGDPLSLQGSSGKRIVFTWPCVSRTAKRYLSLQPSLGLQETE